MLLGVASTSLAGAERGGRAQHGVWAAMTQKKHIIPSPPNCVSPLDQKKKGKLITLSPEFLLPPQQAKKTMWTGPGRHQERNRPFRC
jgi:hypothetical protein